MKVQAGIRYVAILFVCLSAGCEPSAQPDAAANSEAHGKAAADPLNAEGNSISQNDADILAGFSDLASKWNRVAAPLVRDYVDPNVPAARWVRDASAQVGGLRAVFLEMHANALGIQDPGIRRLILEIVQNYRSKLDSVTALHNTVAVGDQDGEQRAQERLAAASAEGQNLARSLLERLRPFVDPSELTAVLKKRGKDIGALLVPQ